MAHGEIAENKVRMSLVISKTLKEDLSIIAEAEGRSLNNMISVILSNYRFNNAYKYPEIDKRKYPKK